MSVIIRLQNLPWSANAADIRGFFKGLLIPEGGVHIVGGEQGDAFIAFGSDEDARLAMRKTGEILKGIQITLLLSSRAEMQKVIETAREQALAQHNFLSASSAQPAAVTPAPTPAPAALVPPASVSQLMQQPSVGQSPGYLPVGVPASATQAYQGMGQYYAGMYGQQQQQQPYYNRPSQQDMLPQQQPVVPKAPLSHHQPNYDIHSSEPKPLEDVGPRAALKPPFGYGTGFASSQFGAQGKYEQADSRWQREVSGAPTHNQLPGVKQLEHPAMARDVPPARQPFEGHSQLHYDAQANRGMYNMTGAPSQVNSQANFDRPYRNSDGPSRALEEPAGRETFKDAYDEKELYRMSQPVRPPSFDRPPHGKNAFSEQQQQLQPRPGQPPFVQANLPRAPSSHDLHSASASENNKQYNNQQHLDKSLEKENINIGKGNLTDDKLRSGVSSRAVSSASSSLEPSSQKPVTSSDKRDDKTARDRDNNKDRDKDKPRDRDRSVKDPKDKEGSDRDRESNRRRRSSSRSRSRDRDRRRRHRSRSRSRDRGSRRRRSRSKERQERQRDRDKDKDKDKSRSTSGAFRDRGERRSNDGGSDKAAVVEKPTSNSGATLPGLGEIPRELPKELSTTLVGKRNNQEMITSDMHLPLSQMATNSARAEAWPSTMPPDKNTNKTNQMPHPGIAQSSFDRNMSSSSERVGLHASRWNAAHGKPSDPRTGSAEPSMAEYDLKRPGPAGPPNKRADDWEPAAGAPSKPWGHPEDPRRTIGQLSVNNMRISEKDSHGMMDASVPHFRDQKALFENSRTSSERFQDDSWSASGKPIKRFPGPRDDHWSSRDVSSIKGPVNGPHVNARLSDGGTEMRARDTAYPHEGLPGGHQSHRSPPPRNPGAFHDSLPRGPLGLGDALGRDPFKAPGENLPRVLLATPDIPLRNCMVEPVENGKVNWRPPSDKLIGGDPRSRDHDPFVEGRSDRQYGPLHGPKHFSADPLMDSSINEKSEVERFVGNRHHREPGGIYPEVRRDTEPFRGERFADPRFRGDRMADDCFPDDYYEEGWEGGVGRGMPKRGGLDGRGAGRFLRRGFGRFDADSYKEPYMGEGSRTVISPNFDRPPRGTFRGASRFRSSRFPVDEPFEEGTNGSPPGGFRGRGGFGRGRGGRGGVVVGGGHPPPIGDRPPTCSIEMLNLPTTASYRSVREVFYGIFVPRDAIKLLGDENGHRIGVGLVRFKTERDAFEASQRDGSFIFENCIQIRLIDEEIYDKHEDVGLLNRFSGTGSFEHSKEIMPTEWVHIKGIAVDKNEEEVAHIFSQYYINDILKEVNPQTKKITGGFFMRLSCPEEASTAVLECDGTETEEGIFYLRQALMEEVMESTLKFSERHNQDSDRSASEGEKEHDSRFSENREDDTRRHEDQNKKNCSYINPNVAKHLDLVRGLDSKFQDRTNNDNSKDLNNKKPLLATPVASNSNEQSQQQRGKQDNTSGNGAARDEVGSKRSIHEMTGGAEEGSPSAKKATSTRDLLTDSVLITGVKMGTTRSNVIDFFSDAGLIPEHVHFEPYDPKQGGTVYVIFPQIANARQAVEKSGQYLGPACVGIELIAKPDVMKAMGLPFNPIELIKKGDGSTSKDVSNSSSTGNEHNEKNSNTNNDNSDNNTSSAKKDSEEKGAPVRLIRQPLLNTPQRSRTDTEPRQPVIAPSASSSSSMPSAQEQKAASPSPQEPTEGATDPAEVPKQGEVAPDKFGKPGCVVALGNIPFRATTEDIITFLSRDFPHIVPENVIRRYNEHNLPTSDARVAFDSPQQAEEAISKLNRRMIFNRPIYLSLV